MPNTFNVTPFNENNNESRLKVLENQIYSSNDINYLNPSSNFGFREPYVYTKINDSNIKKFIKKYDSRVFPIGSATQDLQRISSFISSQKGLLFTTNQYLLQSQNAFNETTLYNPLMPTLAVSRNLTTTFGNFLNRPTRHIDTSDGVLGAAKSLFGVNFGGGSSIPAGTLGSDALSTLNKSEGAGLQRPLTALSSTSTFDTKYNPSNPTGLKNKLFSSFSSNLSNFSKPFANLGKQEGVYKLYDNKAFSSMYENTTNNNSLFKAINKDGGEDLPNLPYNGERNSSGKFLVKFYKTNPANLYTSVLNESEGSVNVGESGKYIEAVKNADVNGIDSKSVLVSQVYDKWGNLENSLDSQGGNNKVSELNSQLKTILSKISDDTSQSNNQVLLNSKTYSQIPKSNRYALSEGSYEKTYVTSEQKLEGNAGKQFPNYSSTNKELRIDQINKQKVISGDKTPLDDLIPFYFKDLVNNKIIQFRCTVKGISDNSTAEWQEIRYLGRADNIFIYRGFSRDVSFNFMVYASSVEELNPMWNRINYLKGLTLPSNYTPPTNIERLSRFIVPPFITFTLGDLYVKQPAILSSVSLSIPEEASWELTNSKDTKNYKYLNNIINRNDVNVARFPMMCEISISTKIIEKERPQTGIERFGSSINGEGAADNFSKELYEGNNKIV